MKIGLIGGTGDLGRALALHWSKNHIVYIGSRDARKAKRVAAEYLRAVQGHYREAAVLGLSNQEAAERGEVVVLTIPHDAGPEFVRPLARKVGEKVVISPVSPMKKDEAFSYKPLGLQGSRILSFAEAIAAELPTARVVSALHAVPAKRLAAVKEVLECDVPLAGDDMEAVNLSSALIAEIPRLRPLYIGPLKASYLVEALAPLLVNLYLYSKLRRPAIRFV